MGLVDDYVLRQIRKIGELAQALAARRSEQEYEDVEAELRAAYRSLLGMDVDLVDPLSAPSLARLLGERDQIRALALLLRAHGDLCVSRGDAGGAAHRFEKALALLTDADDPDLRHSLEERLGRT
jgi:hypothetical protein